MALSPDTEWVIVSCGLIAHADGVLDGEECERLLTMLDDELDGDAYSEWLGLVSDREGLEQRFEQLPVPAAHLHRDLLEQAWNMAMVDGDRCEAEVEALHKIAAKLGVEGVQLDFWREAWTTSEHNFSEQTALAAARVLGGGQPLVGDDAKLIAALVDVLPTTDEHRDVLRETVPGEDEGSLGRALAAQPRKARIRLLRLVAPLVVEAVDQAGSRDRFNQFASGAGIPQYEVERIMQRAHA